MIARVAPRLEALDLLGFGLRRHREDGVRRAGKWRRLALHEAIDSHHDLLAAFDRLDPPRVRQHKLLFHIAVIDGGYGPAERFDMCQLFLGLALEPPDLLGDRRCAVENVAVLEQVGLIGEDLLHAKRPLLIPRARQAERFIPCRQLHRSRAGALGQRHRQHLDEDAGDVVLRLLLRESQRIDLYAVAEQSLLGIIDAVALGGDLVPELGESAHLAQLGDEPQAGIDEEGDASDHVTEGAALDRARGLHGVEHRDRRCERKREFLHRRRTRLLQVIGAHVDRVPLRHLAGGEQDHVLSEPHGGGGRKHVGAAGEIFLDDVVLRGPLQFLPRDALFVGERDIEREQPGGRRVDGH